MFKKCTWYSKINLEDQPTSIEKCLDQLCKGHFAGGEWCFNLENSTISTRIAGTSLVQTELSLRSLR